MIIAYVKRCYRCQWGKTYIVTDEQGKFNGESSPLWKNASPGCFLAQFIFSILMIFSVVAAYVITINGLEDNCTVQYKPWIIGQLIVVFFSGIVDFILYKIKYASDDRWFRLISVVIGQILLLIMIGGLSLLQGLYVLLGMGQECYDAQPDEVTGDVTAAVDEYAQDSPTPINAFAKEIWMANFFISCCTCLILILKLVLLCLLLKNFYINTSKYIAIASKPEEKKFAD